MSASLQKKVGLAALVMTASVFLSRIIGLLREAVIAAVGGYSMEVDAYNVAFILPEILNHVVASGFLSIVFIPMFTRYLVQGDEEEGWRVFSIILTGFGSLLLLGIAVTWIWAPQLTRLIAPGRTDPQFHALVVQMTRIVIPAQFFFFAGGMCMAVQYAKEKFLIPALAPLFYNIGIIAGGLLLSRYCGMAAFSWGALGGAIISNFALQFWAARKVGLRLTLCFDWSHPALREYILKTLPLMLGLGMAFSTELFQRFFGSFLPDGDIGGLNWGYRIMFALAGLFGQAIGVAIYPFISRFVAEKNFAEVNRLLNGALKYIAVVIAFAALLMVLRHEIVAVIYRHGAFSDAAAGRTAHIMLFWLVGAFAFASQTVVTRGYYAMQNTLLPAIYQTLAVVISLPLWWVGLKLMGAAGVALAASLVATLQVLWLYALWNRRSHNRQSKAVYGFFFKMIVISMPVGMLLEGGRRLLVTLIPTGTFWGSLLVAAVISGFFLILLVVTGHVFKIPEIAETIRRLTAKLGGRRRAAQKS